MMSKCDICNIETNNLSDYFCNLCHSCKVKYTDIVLLKRIGDLMCKIESMEQIKDSGHDLSNVDDFFEKMRSGYVEEGLL